MFTLRYACGVVRRGPSAAHMRICEVACFGVVCVVASVLAGCCGTPAQSGSVYVTALSTTDWQRYKDQFQPRFELSEAEALRRAVPDTLQLERSILDTLSVGIRIKTIGGELTGHDDTAELKPDAAAASGPAKAVDAPNVIDASKLQVDPRLQYLLATALWQEVQVLNRFVEDAAVSGFVGNRDTGEGVTQRYAPFITRLQIANFPQSAAASYTADLRITFTNGVSGGPAPRVVPLLINDHVEAALSSWRDEELQRFTLALLAVLKGVGVGADIESLHSEFNKALAREFHGLLTVGQPEVNELAVRVGARRVNDKEYRATSEPHHLTVLLLIPLPLQRPVVTFQQDDGGAPLESLQVNVSYKTSLSDAYTGAPLSAEPRDKLDGSFDLVVKRPASAWLRGVQTALAFDDGAKTVVTLNDAVGFYPDDVIATWFFKVDDDETLHALSSGAVRMVGNANQLAFEFPSLRRMGVKPRPGDIPSHFKSKAVGAVIPSSPVDRSAMHPSPERSFMVKVFNSRPSSEESANYLFYPWRYATADAKPDLKAGMKVTTSRSLLPHSNHAATLDVHITLPEVNVDGVKTPVSGFKLLVQGADATITSTTPAGVAGVPASGPRTHFELLRSGTVTLALGGLYKDGKVVLKVVAPAGWATVDDIELKVID